VSEVKASISGGHVYCHVQRKDMDIEKCFTCSRLRTLADEASPPFIICDTGGVLPSGDDERAYAQWRYQHHRTARQT
jgi:hypothetical protein